MLIFMAIQGKKVHSFMDVVAQKIIFQANMIVAKTKVLYQNQKSFLSWCQNLIKTLNMNIVHLICQKIKKVQPESRCLNSFISIMFILWSLVFAGQLMEDITILRRILWIWESLSYKESVYTFMRNKPVLDKPLCLKVAKLMGIIKQNIIKTVLFKSLLIFFKMQKKS